MLHITLTKSRCNRTGDDIYVGADDDIVFTVTVPDGKELTSMAVEFEVDDEDESND